MRILLFVKNNSRIIYKLICVLIIASLFCFSIQMIFPTFVFVCSFMDTKEKYGKLLGSIFFAATISLAVYLHSPFWILQIVGCIAILILSVWPLKKESYEVQVWNMVLPLFIFEIMEWLQYCPGNVLELLFTQEIDKKLLLIFSYLIILSLCSIGKFLLERKGSYILVGNSLYLLAVVNFFVKSFTGNSFQLRDIFLADTAFSVLSTYQLTTNQIFILITGIAGIVAYNWIVLNVIDKIEKRKRKTYLKGCIISAIYLSVFYMLFMGANRIEILNYKASEKYSALIGFLLSSTSELSEPKDYDYYIGTELESIPQNGKENAEYPNVIVIMSEAFSDLEVNGYFETNQSVIPYTKQIMEESISGYVYSSVWGNNTVSSEFEFLTGIPTAFTTKGANIYQSYLNDEIPSITKVLKGNGYRIYGIHPYYGDGYNREEAWKCLGFENELFLENFEDSTSIRGYVSDADCFNTIEEIVEREEEPVFIFNVTMQNHGGYTEDPDLEDKVHAESLNQSNLDHYLTLIHESDKAMEQFITQIEESKEPTIILFFGDHQPSLAEFYTDLLNKTEENMNLQEIANRYKIPFFIWANYGLEQQEVIPEEISINYLPGILLSILKINDPWFDFTHQLLYDYPVISENIYKLNGNICSEDVWHSFINKIKPGDGEKLDAIKRYEAYSYGWIKEPNRIKVSVHQE